MQIQTCGLYGQTIKSLPLVNFSGLGHRKAVLYDKTKSKIKYLHIGYPCTITSHRESPGIPSCLRMTKYLPCVVHGNDWQLFSQVRLLEPTHTLMFRALGGIIAGFWFVVPSLNSFSLYSKNVENKYMIIYKRYCFVSDLISAN